MFRSNNHPSFLSLNLGDIILKFELIICKLFRQILEKKRQGNEAGTSTGALSFILNGIG